MIKLIVGTQTGTAEFVADEIADALNEHDLPCDITLEPTLAAPQTKETWIVCTSTHGAGEVPDNLKPFFNWLTQDKPDLSQVNYLVLGLGDSSYDTFCKAAHDVKTALDDQNAHQLLELFSADAMEQELPEDLILAWLSPQLDSLKPLLNK